MFEGTGKYFLILFLIFFIVYLTVKICLSKLFKEARVQSWKAFIPIYNGLVLTDLLDLKRTIFFKTLIPFANLYYYKVIIAELLKVYNLNPKEAIWFVLIPMYKFPELVFKNPKFTLHMYDDTEEFIHNQNTLFEEEQTVDNVPAQSGEILIDPKIYSQVNDTVQEEPPVNLYTKENPDNVYSNQSLNQDERQETVIEAKEEKPKEEKPIVVDNSRPKVCPKCGTKLSPNATTCFLCGTQVL